MFINNTYAIGALWKESGVIFPSPIQDTHPPSPPTVTFSNNTLIENN